MLAQSQIHDQGDLMASMFRQAELLKAVSEWVRLGYVVEVTAEGIKVMPKGAEKSPDEFAGVSMARK